MRKWMNLVNEDCLTKGEIKKGTWTYWQDRDGIYVTLPGSNSCFAGFCSQDEALHFAAEQGPKWKVVRWGKFKTMSDAEALADYDVRRDRMRHGFYVGPLAEDLQMDVEDEADLSTPTEDAAYERQQRIEKAVKDFCQTEIGWDMDTGYSVIFDGDENTLTISPNEVEVSLEQLNKLATLGSVMVNGSSKSYGLTIDVKTPEGFDIHRS